VVAQLSRSVLSHSLRPDRVSHEVTTNTPRAFGNRSCAPDFDLGTWDFFRRSIGLQLVWSGTCRELHIGPQYHFSHECNRLHITRR
jgi:hypothetical protein